MLGWVLKSGNAANFEGPPEKLLSELSYVKSNFNCLKGNNWFNQSSTSICDCTYLPSVQMRQFVIFLTTVTSISKVGPNMISNTKLEVVSNMSGQNEDDYNHI
jgi:hypothetical protein